VQERPGRLSAEAERTWLRRDALAAGIALLAVYDLALAACMAASPHSFFANVGPFGARNDHYIRDTATFSAALGVGLLLAIRKPSWRVPMVAISTIQFALHSVNHLVDIDRAHPAWNGYFAFFSLTAATILLAWLLRVALADAEVGPPRT